MRLLLHDIAFVAMFAGVWLGGYVLGRVHNPAPMRFEVDPDPLPLPERYDNVIPLRARRAA